LSQIYPLLFRLGHIIEPKGSSKNPLTLRREVAIMSLANFDDIYGICCDWEMESVFEDVIMVGLNRLSSDTFTYTMTSRGNRLGEIAGKEMLNEKREVVLV
jgi:hypothetical protein